MFLAAHVHNKSRALLPWLLQCSKPRPYPLSNSRAQSIKSSYFTNILGNRFQHTITLTTTQTTDDVQDHESISIRPSIRPKRSSISSGPDAIKKGQANQLQQQPGLKNIEPFKEESAPKATYKQRRAFAEKNRRHKENKVRRNDVLKERGRTSYDWRIPLALLEKRPPKQEYRPVQLSGHRLVRSLKQRRAGPRQLHVDQIEQPLVWSTFTFRNYIENLTSSQVNILFQRRLYARGDSHKAALGRRLVEVFKDPSMREFLSPEAFTLAISFFFRIYTLPPAIALFDYIEWLNMDIPTEMVDIMLRSAASCNDLHNFTHLLQLFLKRGVTPTTNAWASLLMVVQSRKARSVILKSMLERELLEDFSTMRDIVHIVIHDEMIKHLDNKLDLASFLTYMDSQFGTEWLSVSAGNMILFEIGQRRPIPEAVNYLDILKKRGMVPDTATLNTLLGMCKRERNHLLAIVILQKFQAEHRVRLDQLGYQILFMEAWRSRMYNFTRVIWRFACIEGVATWEIRKRVHQSLMRTADTSEHQPENRAHIWSVSAGEVIVGINWPDNIDGILSTRTEAMERLRAYDVIADDLAAAGRYQSVDGLATLLLKALQLDRDWMKTGAWKTQSTRWKRENALPILVEKVDSPRISSRRLLTLRRVDPLFRKTYIVPQCFVEASEITPRFRRIFNHVPDERRRMLG